MEAERRSSFEDPTEAALMEDALDETLEATLKVALDEGLEVESFCRGGYEEDLALPLLGLIPLAAK